MSQPTKSPSRMRSTTVGIREAGLPLAAALAVAVALIMALLIAPREAIMGDIQRIFYFHVAASWSGYLALLVTCIASIFFLRSDDNRHDLLAASSAEIGLLLITAGIITGMLWARPVWGTWWTWDPRLTTSAILWLLYAAYFALRNAIDEPSRRARLAGVYSIIAFVAVPLNFMAIRWWRGMHPRVIAQPGGGLTPIMLITLLVSVAAFTLLYAALLLARFRVALLEERVQRLRARDER
jgi:heme exporter protein C